MAARTRKIRHDESTREKIRGSQLVNRLQYHILGEVDPSNPKAGKVEMSTSQVNAAVGLLRKVLPDLAATDLHVKGQLEQSIIDMVMGLEHAAPATMPRLTSDGETIN